jgi:glycosyltransferase involved in cell wall biosynthesis
MPKLNQMPLVSCIMPTRNRRPFVPQAVQYFLRQDYPRRELIIVDDGDDEVRDLVPRAARIRYLRPGHKITIGAKRNLACATAKGTVILHWDDDDWMADWRISYQVTHLLRREADVCGLHKLFFYDISSGQTWLYVYSHPKGIPWLSGSTMCYTKAFWQANPFLNINVGEDTRFVRSKRPKQIVTLPKSTFLVALIHPGNTSPKRAGDGWYTYPTAKARQLMGQDWHFYASLQPHMQDPHRLRRAPGISAQAPGRMPLVSCVMATYNRRHLLPRAIQYFLRQDYANRELLILDDGTDCVSDLIPGDPRIRYFRLPKKHSLGVKRNLGCGAADGEIVIFWDDDDWYAPNRITYQVTPIVDRQADMTALDNSLLFCLPTRQFWTCTTKLHERMFLYGVVGGTLAFRKALWSQGTRFPDYSLAEESAFIKEAVCRGARLQKLANRGVFVYVRHEANTWKFEAGEFLDRNGWRRVGPPPFIPERDLQFYGVSRKVNP